MPPVASLPYPLVSDVTRRVRAIINDMGAITGVAGNIFADTQPYVFEYCQAAYEKLQKVLVRNGYETPKKEFILAGIAPVASPNAGTQVFISQNGYNDGATNHASPALPPDLLMPIRLWERWTGSVCEFAPMNSVIDALPSRWQYAYLAEWQWRQDCLFFVGATQTIDVRMEYKQFFPALAALNQQLQIRDSINAMAYLTAALWVEGKNPAQAEIWKDRADEEIGDLLAPTQQMKSRQNPRREPYGGYIWRR